MTKLLTECRVYPSKQVLHKAHWGATYYRDSEDMMPMTVSTVKIPCVEILMSEDVWDRITMIVHMFELEQDNPVLKDLADQYRMMRLLTQEKK